jgi:uncharacterized membrane protein YgcG
VRGERLVRRTLLVAAAVIATLGLTGSAALADDWGPRSPGKHVYDQAGVLTADQIASLEETARAVEQLGSPTIVYVRHRLPAVATTRVDAGALMSAWDVESAPGKNDGVVLLADAWPLPAGRTVTVDGQPVSVAGSAAIAAGSNIPFLDAAEVHRITDQSLQPLMAQGEVAAALLAALLDVKSRLSALQEVSRLPPPSPGPASPASSAAGLLLALGGVTVSLLLAIGRLTSTRGRRGRDGS